MVEKTASGNKEVTVIPKFKEVSSVRINDIVYCEVIKVDVKNARTKIIATDSKVFDANIEATLLKENSRAHDLENVNLTKMFAPKDIIKAKVLTVKQMGEGSSSLITLSTVDEGFGVVPFKQIGM